MLLGIPVAFIHRMQSISWCITKIFITFADNAALRSVCVICILGTRHLCIRIVFCLNEVQAPSSTGNRMLCRLVYAPHVSKSPGSWFLGLAGVDTLYQNVFPGLRKHDFMLLKTKFHLKATFSKCCCGVLRQVYAILEGIN